MQKLPKEMDVVTAINNSLWKMLRKINEKNIVKR